LNSQNSVLKQVTSMTFSDFLKEHLLDKDQYYGTHFDYIEYMWSLKDDPNVLIVFYEDLITVRSCLYSIELIAICKYSSLDIL